MKVTNYRNLNAILQFFTRCIFSLLLKIKVHDQFAEIQNYLIVKAKA